MSIFNALNTALYSRLTGATAVTSLLSGTAAVYFDQAPDDAVLPYVVFSYQASGDENQAPQHRIKSMLVWARAYTQAGAAAAGTIDAAIDAQLHHNALTVTGWTNFWLAREQDVFTVELDPPNVKTYVAGGMYRVRVDNH